MDSKDPIAARIGQNIRRFRKQRELSQRELAKLLPKTGSNEISKYERGLQVPRTHTLYEITQALRVSMDDLLNPPPEERDGRVVAPDDPSPQPGDGRSQAVDTAEGAGPPLYKRRRNHA